MSEETAARVTDRIDALRDDLVDTISRAVRIASVNPKYPGQVYDDVVGGEAQPCAKGVGGDAMVAGCQHDAQAFGPQLAQRLRGRWLDRVGHREQAGEAAVDRRQEHGLAVAAQGLGASLPIERRWRWRRLGGLGLEVRRR